MHVRLLIRQLSQGALEVVHLIGAEALTDLACQNETPAQNEADWDGNKAPGGGLGSPLGISQGEADQKAESQAERTEEIPGPYAGVRGESPPEHGLIVLGLGGDREPGRIEFLFTLWDEEFGVASLGNPCAARATGEAFPEPGHDGFRRFPKLEIEMRTDAGGCHVKTSPGLRIAGWVQE